MEPGGSADSKDGPIDTRIFAVSKQIHEEASDAFFRENVVMVALGDDAFLGLPPLMFRDDASDIQRAYVKKLRKVAIMLPMARESEAPRLQWVLERVCQALTLSAFGEGQRETIHVFQLVQASVRRADGQCVGIDQAHTKTKRRQLVGAVGIWG
ncbi:MAG: hypothetical protein Q9192_004100 [Flavoplaca navasiana]